jgi:hypothetical protein
VACRAGSHAAIAVRGTALYSATGSCDRQTKTTIFYFNLKNKFKGTKGERDDNISLVTKNLGQELPMWE